MSRADPNHPQSRPYEVTTAQHVSSLALYLFLLSPLPLQLCLGDGRDRLDLILLFSVVNSLLWLALGHTLVRRPLILHLALAPLFLTTAIDLFLLVTFNGRLSAGYVTIAMTDYPDTAEFLAAYAGPLSLFALVLLGVYLAGLCGIRRLHRVRRPRLAAVALLLLTGSYAVAVARGVVTGNSFKGSVLDTMGKEWSAPAGAVFQSALAFQIYLDGQELRGAREHHSFAATKAPGPGGEVYVWVIGESSRPNNWSVFGYERDTTPRLRAIPGIIFMPNMLTTAPSTAVAVPSMLSLRPITDWPSVLAQRSIVSAFNETGFKTYWASTQEAASRPESWAGLIPQIAGEAKSRRYFERTFDGVLVDELRTILAAAGPSENLFIVLHSKGSHFEFSRRYPPHFARFGTTNPTRREHLVDLYDNTIFYTDWFLSEVIATLSKRGGQSAVMYASDHGENLLDDERQLFGHAMGTDYDLHTAAFFWVSDSSRSRYADRLMIAERNAVAPLSLSNLPHSLLDLAGIHALGVDPEMSLFNSRFAPKQRAYLLRGELRKESAAGEGRP